jgi:hypothetical protein
LIGCLEFGTKGALLLRLKTLTTWKENQFGWISPWFEVRKTSPTLNHTKTFALRLRKNSENFSHFSRTIYFIGGTVLLRGISAHLQVFSRYSIKNTAHENCHHIRAYQQKESDAFGEITNLAVGSFSRTPEARPEISKAWTAS